MKGEAMNGSAKLVKVGKMTSDADKATNPERKKASPRNPLKELNVRPVSQLQASAEVQRGGCFRFLLSTSSSKEESVLKYNSKPQTPKSAPPSSRILCSKTLAKPSAFRKKIPPKTVSENSLKLESKNPAKPKTPDLLQRWKQGGSISRGRIIGKNTEQERTFQVSLKGKNGSHWASTPRKPIISEGWVNLSSQFEEANHQLSVSPASNSTPLIEASISPEVPCASSVVPTTACYAVGHVISGVHDRRKCRPRGNLTIVEEKSNVSRDTALPPSVVAASIRWFSSPIKTASGSENGSYSSNVRAEGFSDDAAKDFGIDLVKKKTSITDVDKFGLENSPLSHTSILRTPTSDSSSSPFSVIVRRAEASYGIRALNHKEKGKYRYDSAYGISSSPEKSWGNSIHVSTPSSNSNSRRIIPETLGIDLVNTKAICDDKFGLKKSPLSQTSVLRTPSDSNLSPFSLIVQRAKAISELRVLTPHKDKGGRAYGNAFDISPCSENFQCNSNAVSTPSHAYPRRKDIIPPLELGSATYHQALETMKLSPIGNNNASLLPSLSFKSGFPSTPLSFVNLNHFKNSKKDEFLGAKKKDKNSPVSGARISWREGILSRIFEMGDLEFFQHLSDVEEDVDCSRDGQVSSKFDSLFSAGNTFGSFKFLLSDRKKGVQKCESDVSPLEPITFAESISTEDGGLFSSGDSYWTLFYKNDLFEL